VSFVVGDNAKWDKAPQSVMQVANKRFTGAR